MHSELVMTNLPEQHEISTRTFSFTHSDTHTYTHRCVVRIVSLMSWFGCSWVMGMSAWWDLTPAWESVLSAPNCTRWFIGLQPLADEGDTTRLSRADHKQFARSTCFLYFELSCSLKKTKKPSQWHCTVTVRPSVNSAWEHIYIFYAFWSLYSRVPNSIYLLPVLRHLWIRTQSFRLVSNHLATTGDKGKIFIPRLVAGGWWLYAWNRLLKPKSRRHRDQ